MSKPKKFGTFAGVFTPSILTILGVIMYQRMGQVVGNAGLFGSLGIVILAHVISIATGLSISSIATDKKVGAGGVYYVLSRSLGLPIGGALGLTLFVATGLSISLYLVGFSEVLNQVIGFGIETGPTGEPIEMDNYLNSIRFTATIALVGLTVLALISTSLALKSQYVILGAIAVSLVAIFFGSGDLTPIPENKVIPPKMGFAEVFAIFFPAVTGFTAGVAMSGDLKDPKKSIPLGTMAAIGVGLVIYVVLTLYTYFRFPEGYLIMNYRLTYYDIAIWTPLVLLGVWGATLSSALGGILGGPRILQAMSVDRITPKVFAKGVGQSNEPRNALLLTVAIAWVGVLIGDLNVIAGVVSMFYLAAYGFINLSFFLESWASSDFKPTFKVKKWIGLAGFIATIVVMSQLNLAAMLLAFLIIGGIFFFLSRRQVALGTGDIWQSVWSTIVKKGLKRMEAVQDHKRNWKPNILLFSSATTVRSRLIEFARSISGQGIITNFDLVEKPDAEVLFPKSKEVVEDDELEGYGIFGRRLEVQNSFKGIESIACTFGFSGVEPNTVLMAWPGETNDPIWFSQMTHKLMALDYNVLYLDYDPRWGFRKKEKIDLWWRGVGNNAELMLSLAKFVTSSPEWSQANVRILLVNETNADSKIIENRVQFVLEQFRVEAEIKIINNEVDQKPIYELMKMHSGEADLVFVGIPELDESNIESFVERTNDLIHIIGTTLLVKASSQFDETDLKIEHVALKEEAQKVEQAELIPLNESADAAFTEALIKLDEQYEGIVDTMIQQSVKGIESYHHTIYAKITDCMDRFLDKILTEKDQEKIHDWLDDALDEVNLLLNEMIENQLPVVTEEFDKEVKVYLANKEDFIMNLPVKLQLNTVLDDAENPLNKRHYVKLREIMMRMWFSDGLSETQDQFNEFGYYNLILLHQSKNLLHDTVWEILNSLYRETDLIETVKNCKVKLDEKLKSIDHDALHLASGFYRRIRNNERDNLNELATIALHKNYRKLVQKEYPNVPASKLQHTKKELTTYANYWSRNISLFTNQLESDIALMKFSAKMQLSCDYILAYTDENYLQLIHKNIDQLNTLTERIKELVAANNTEELLATNTQLAEEIFFNSEFIIGHLMKSAEKMLELIPEEMILMTARSINEIRDKQGKTIKTEKVDLREITEYFVKKDFLDPLHQQIQQYHDQLKRCVGRLINVSSTLYTGIDKFAAGQSSENILLDLKEALHEISQAKIDAQAAQGALEVELRDRRERLKNELDINQIIEQLESLSQYAKQQKRRNKISDGLKQLNQFTGEKLRGAVGYFSEKQKDLQAGDYIQSHETVISEQARIADFMDKINIKTDLPFYYQQLFTGTQFVDNTTIDNRKNEVDKAKKVLTRIEGGKSGALLILGSAASGKTFLTGHISNHVLDGRVFKILPPTKRVGGQKDLTRAFQRVTGSRATLTEIMNELPERSTLIFENIEQWWVKSSGNKGNLTELSKLISEYGNRHYFILNANIYAYHRLSQNSAIAESILGTIILPPLSAKQIRDTIWTRHQTGGLTANLDGVNQRHLSATKINKFLNKYHGSSGGVIGLALQQWIESVEEIKENELILKPPVYIEFPELKKTGTANLMYQLFIHFALSKSDCYSLYGKDQKDWIDRTLKMLEIAGLINLNERDAYAINKLAKPYVENWLHEHGFIRHI